MAPGGAAHSRPDAGQILDHGLAIAPGVSPHHGDDAPAVFVETRVVEVPEPCLPLDLTAVRQTDVINTDLINLFARSQQAPDGQLAIGVVDDPPGPVVGHARRRAERAVEAREGAGARP